MAVTTSSSAHSARESAPQFSLEERLLLGPIGLAGFLAIRSIGRTMRCTITAEDGMETPDPPSPRIYVFWHRCIFPSAWIFRHREIQVMTSRSFDGESIARVSARLGFGAVRGSSSRGGVRALLGMHTELEQGRSVAFTIDGPRGPMYVAKPGPVLLARNTQVPLVCFHIALSHRWEANSWDRFMVPKPFSRAYLRFGEPLHIPSDADSHALTTLHAQMQATLDRVRVFAEAEVEKS
ncbi:MAG: lysophospholipid acyltransferase family protein [Candidatus Korobacteraceae bacterium]